MSDSPRLPWEVIERIVSHSGDHRTTLHSLSLTCKQLRPRSLCLMFAEVRFEFRDTADVLAFRDFLDAYPHLRPLVRSIRTHRNAYLALHLLCFLPKLTHITMNGLGPERWECSLPQRVLACYRVVGTRIKTLKLSSLSFPNLQEFCRILLAFTGIRTLSCSLLDIRNTTCASAQLAQFKQHLSRQLRLSTLEIDGSYENVMAQMLFQLVPSTLKNLTLDLSSAKAITSQRWPLLRALTITIVQGASWRGVKTTIEMLKDYRPKSLAHFTIRLLSHPRDLLRQIGGRPSELQLCWELDRILLKFRHPNVLFDSPSIHDRRTNLWSQEMARYFPSMGNRRLLKFASEQVTEICHEDQVFCVAYSPDGKWVVTGSGDCTIILWDSDGQLVQEWVAHAGGVMSLAFSPDSRRLASSGGDRYLAVWDIMPGKGHPPIAMKYTDSDDDSCACAWSPNGTVIASADVHTETVKLWNARTLEPLHLLKPSLGTGEFCDLRFSPDGRWVASVSSNGCCIWDVSAGTVHKVLQSEHSFSSTTAFNPQSTRLATGHRGGVVQIWNVQTGEVLFKLEQHTRSVMDVVFSSDDTRILSASVDRTVKIWDASTGTFVLSLEGHADRVNVARFSPCGKYVASASRDQAVRVWRTDDGSCVGTLSEHRAKVDHVAFSPDGKTLSSGARNGTVIIRRMRDIIPVPDTNM
ncbi:quinon protein alcohol dehydrogenase-like superfamily [Dichomitus squalens]|uniref:Quinon protein alcohol dehydrogenase-like superfamily n=1 Tax=Dichomitus squalens TaxID=114155 RepID=A0A4Q9MGM5_9APHY|nr:quinon protein alcohol dehydrogenase-like superfamily [Dichomitus squalens]